jgi:hypothetical protein
MFLALFMTVDLLVYLPLIDLGFTEHQTALLEGANQLNKVPEYIKDLECFSYSRKSSSQSFKCANLLRTAQKELLVCVVVLLMSLVNCCFASQPEDPESNKQKVKSLLSKFSLKLFFGVSVSLGTKATVFLSTVRSQEAVFYISLVLSILILAALIFAVYKLCALACSQPGHAVFDGLRPTKLSSLYWALVILHRLVYSVTVAGFDFPAVQLSVLTSSTLGVRPMQLFVYTLVVRPQTTFKALFQQAGGLLLVGVTLSSFTLKALHIIDDEATIDSICMCAVIGTLLVSVLALIIGIVSTAVEIWRTEDAEEASSEALKVSIELV